MNREVKVEIIRSDGQHFIMDGTNWKIPNDGLGGWGDVENDLTIIDNSIGDGSVLSSKRIGKKDRTIKGVVSNSAYNDIFRRVITSFFVAKYTYDVYVTYMGITRWATGELYKFNSSMKNVRDHLEFTATFMFVNPFLKSVEDFGKNIASVSGGGFPYLCQIDKTGFTGILNFANQVVLENDGDVDCYCVAVFTAKGSVVNPKLIINDRYVRILDTMASGDIITIDFTKSPPTVTKNGDNIIGKTDRTSTFEGMELPLGDSVISFTADNGSSLLDVSIYFNKLYCSM